MDNFQYYVLTIQVKGQQSFWYPSGAWQTFGYLAMAGQSLEIGILKKHKMAPRGSVWLNFFC